MFDRVEIKNFRSCYDTKLDLGQSICALSGRNGVGKSNILKAIEWTCKSAISPNAVNIGSAGNLSQEVDEYRIYMQMTLDSITYDYTLISPGRSKRKLVATSQIDEGLKENLRVLASDCEYEDIVWRQGDEIRIADRPDAIRVPKFTPSIAALRSLLPPDMPVLSHINRIAEFFGGVRYYSLDDRPDAKDSVTEQQYTEWLFKYQSEGQLTDSVALRLLYMWQEDRVLLNELMSLIGPEGIGLIDEYRVLPFERRVTSSEANVKETSGPTKVYYIIFYPPGHMGGAASAFTFQELSVGTRRVIRIVTSLLFDKRSLMLLEQPEDSIHSGLLRKLIDMLRSYSYKTQMIFTTHSLEVLDIMQPEEVLLVTATDGKTQARKLSQGEVALAKKFLKNDGTLSDFLEPFTDQ